MPLLQDSYCPPFQNRGGRMEMKKPAIEICIHQGVEALLCEVLAGIEEEGVPFQVTEIQETSAAALARKGAEQSLLQVGIGIYRDQVCVQYRGAIAQKPLFEYIGQEDTFLRNLGSNAARIVKKKTFKGL